MFINNCIADERAALSDLKSQLLILEKKIEALEKAQVKKDKIHKLKKLNNSPAKTAESVKLYATLRPTFGYINESNENNWDVKDALSHAGIKAVSKFNGSWSAELQGEWGIDLSNNGDFGKARQVYVALNSPIGRIGIGKQRPTQYLFIAEYVDIFNHGNSPFSYDPESIFFVDNLLTYQLKVQNLTWMAVAQFNGDKGDNNSDLFNLGVSYDYAGLHGAVTYLNEDTNQADIKEGENEIYAASLAYSFENLYLAASYQDKTYKLMNNQFEREGHTFDLSAAYQILSNYKVKLGYFDFSDGYQLSKSQDHSGYNATFEWLPTNALRFHLEYLYRDYDFTDNFSSWSIGFRYDLTRKWSY
ncbi:porin [Pseudoalteromonas denitrificans]|nr:porin [Pseudoalteromonas denitrificans]